jgi:hypothetical protein
MAKNVCAKCGHGYSSRKHQTGCMGKSVGEFRKGLRAAYRRQAGTRTMSHRPAAAVLSWSNSSADRIVADTSFYEKSEVSE